MIKVKLFARANTHSGRYGGFVTEGLMPPFLTLPDVILWGSRVFIAPNVDAEIRRLEQRAGEVAYVEAFGYALGNEGFLLGDTAAVSTKEVTPFPAPWTEDG